MDDTDKQKLIEKIKLAWNEVEYPGDDNIFVKDSYDDEGITDYFKGTTWLGHSVQELRAHETAISIFFTCPAYHYWLPAYLIAAIQDPEELSQGIDAIVNSLTPPQDKEWGQEEFQAKMATLSNDQKMVIITVLEYLAELYFDPRIPDQNLEERTALAYLYEITDMA